MIHRDDPLPKFYVDVSPHGYRGGREQEVVAALMERFPHLEPHEVEMVDGTPVMHVTVTAPHDADTDVLMEYVNDDYPGVPLWEVISIRDEQGEELLIKRAAA